MLLKNFEERDFAVLRRPLESGRQSPRNIGVILLVAGLFCQAILLFLGYEISQHSIYPYAREIFYIHLGVSLILAVISILYAIPAIYSRFQKSQYFVSIVISQNLFGVSPYLLVLIMIGADLPVIVTDNIKESLLVFTYVTLTVGVIVLILTSIRFYFLLKRGAYRLGSNKDQTRKKFEKKSYLPAVIIGSTALVLIMQYLLRTLNLENFDTALIVTLLLLIFYTMVFVLPEQLVILYCKFRFNSFNFDSNGTYLISLQETATEDEKSSQKKWQ
ncbi:hypothetical protein [Alkalihalobacterium chitinilyticum]|uniref:ABC transporter ATPase n=1 Tax=Alkalihalobacterium chitinilyticum TaxID=2980103 RepID=A0ABT5VIF7_9BACI|nr:hypothetical protein [Alkalihalobacterium chitinilyticum]MDE5415233.1 hypothetical protein [Alkalihalobacterium chitinilyticum]